MHRYGAALLASLPPHAILLSHTDLDLNPARYLRVCEGLRPDVSHVSVQMMAYEWWGSSSPEGAEEPGPLRQSELHAPLVFPPRLRGVSTARRSEGNALLITRFLLANMRHPLPQAMPPGGDGAQTAPPPPAPAAAAAAVSPTAGAVSPTGAAGARGGPFRPVFLDMQGVDESEIGPDNRYREHWTLLPWGLLYRVLPALSLQDLKPFVGQTRERLKELAACLPQPSVESYPRGSWEFAAGSVLWDAHYQTGLFLLSHALQLAPHIGSEPDLFSFYLQCLRDSDLLLRRTLAAVDASGAFSGHEADLLKNTVLASIRLQSALEVGLPLVPRLRFPPEEGPPTVEEEQRTRESSEALLLRFLRESPGDGDAPAFLQMYQKLKQKSGDGAQP